MVLSTCGQLGVDAAIMSAMKPPTRRNTPDTDNPLSYPGYRFPPDVISYAVWLYYRFPPSLSMVDELLAARGIELTYETVRRWSVKFGLGIARHIRSTALGWGDKWCLDEVVVTINGRKHWLWRAVDQLGAALDEHGRAPRVLITDKA
jgi:putative transposase